jgi:hypothetical protein
MTSGENKNESMHFVTVGADQGLVENLWERIATTGGFRFSHIAHPILHQESWERGAAPSNVHFFYKEPNPSMPSADRTLLSSLEGDEIPTIHNMILGDRFVSKLNYEDALGYATFLTQRLTFLFETLRPTAVIGAFDLLHGSLAFAVARKMGIPWFAMNFSVIPPGFASFCDRLLPTAAVFLSAKPPGDSRSLAESSLGNFESRKLHAAAGIVPPPRSLAGNVVSLPDRIVALGRTIRKSRRSRFLKFVEGPGGHNVLAALRFLRRSAKAHAALGAIPTVSEPPSAAYVFFGLHTQPESSIDVWAPFFSNQLWVIELLARSIPPTHKLLVKIHKSDVANYSRKQLDRMRSFPGVELVAPLADTRRFIERADLLFSIQGTIGLEGALLGKPVIVLGESPVTMFPSASPIGKLTDLPELVRRKLTERPPERRQILDAYSNYLMPFAPAGHNDWTIKPGGGEIEGYVGLFSALARFLRSGAAESIGAT